MVRIAPSSRFQKLKKSLVDYFSKRDNHMKKAVDYFNYFNFDYFSVADPYKHIHEKNMDEYVTQKKTKIVLSYFVT